MNRATGKSCTILLSGSGGLQCPSRGASSQAFKRHQLSAVRQMISSCRFCFKFIALSAHWQWRQHSTSASESGPLPRSPFSLVCHGISAVTVVRSPSCQLPMAALQQQLRPSPRNSFSNSPCPPSGPRPKPPLNTSDPAPTRCSGRFARRHPAAV